MTYTRLSVTSLGFAKERMWLLSRDSVAPFRCVTSLPIAIKAQVVGEHTSGYVQIVVKYI